MGLVNALVKSAAKKTAKKSTSAAKKGIASKKATEDLAYSFSDVLPKSESDKNFATAFKETSLVDETGNPKVFYHGRKTDYDAFDPSINAGEIGTHFGTAEQAADFSKDAGANIVPVYLNIKNPYRMDDYGGFGGDSVIESLANDGIIDYEYVDDILDMSPKQVNSLAKKLLKENGYDGISYLNRFEGLSKNGKRITDQKTIDSLKDLDPQTLIDKYGAKESYIILDPEQAKSVFNKGSWDKKDKRFNYSDGGSVGDKTGQTTQHGRDVYKTSKGENVSEISITFSIGDKWYNAPSIYDGKKYSEDEVINMVKSGKVKPTSVHDNMEDAVSAAKKRSEEMEYAKGGDTMNQQMRLFQDGGMMDNSGEVVNGTEVPTGSLRNEVADDIPAKLSEGEFVLPADVVRFIGLEKLMKMRDAAKAGLARMEEMGQMGNAQEVANPDQSFAGGEEDTSGFESEIDSIISEVDGEQQFASGGMPSVSGENLSGAVKNPMIDVRYFKSDDGRAMYITYYRGKPMTPIPDGFKEVTAEEAVQQTTTEEEKKPATTAITNATGDGGYDGGNNDDGNNGGSNDGSVAGSTSHGGISVGNTGVGSVVGGVLGGIVAGSLGITAGKSLGSWGANQIAQNQTATAISNNLGVSGFSANAVTAAQAAAAEAAGQPGATPGSVAAAAAQAAADADNVDPLDAMMAVTNNFSNTSAAPPGTVAAGPSTAVSATPGGGTTGLDASPAYGGTPTGVANVGPSQPSDSGGDTGGGYDFGGDDGVSGADAMGGYDVAKGGLIKKRKQPAKKRTQKGLAAKK